MNTTYPNTTLPVNTTLDAPPGGTTVTGQNILWALAGLSASTMIQRSGADEFSSADMSPARGSPFICAADLAVATMWVSYGLFNGLTFSKSAKVFAHACHMSAAKDQRGLLINFPVPNGPKLLIHAFFFVLTLFSAMKIFAMKGVPWSQVWAVFYFSAYVVSSTLHWFGNGLALAEFDKEPWLKPDGDAMKRLFDIADVIYCLAYTLQFCCWVGTFTKVLQLPLFATNPALTNTILTSLIAFSLTASVFAPEHILYQFWSLRNWRRREWQFLGQSAFMIFLIMGAPIPAFIAQRYDVSLVVFDKRALESTWTFVSRPLGSLAIAVAGVFLVAFFDATVAWICRRVWPPDEVAASERELEF